MYYDRAPNNGNPQGGSNRVPQAVMLRHLRNPWSAPASSDSLNGAAVNLGLELFGAAAHDATQYQSGRSVTAELDGAFQARNADTWDPDSHILESRRPIYEGAAIGSVGAPPSFPGQNTYYRPVHQPRVAALPDSNYLPHNPGTPLAAFAHLGNHESWHFPHPSLPPDPRHLIANPQTPSITVTDSVATGGFASPQNGFASSSLYHTPQASLNPNSSNDFAISQYTMGSALLPDAASIQIPNFQAKHERTPSVNSNTEMPTPVSMSGPRSPLALQTSRDQHRIPSSPHQDSRRPSEDSSTDGDDVSLSKHGIYKRSQEPPRNRDNKFYCEHQECNGLVFERKCEWSKHMDKHDRPYKCNVKGCEKLQGFTYSGGLLRHEREVHKMHGGTKKSLFCPFTDCKRSLGAGFTRKENLAEHIRRVHRRTSMSADMHGLIIRRDTITDALPTAESRVASESPYARTLEYREDEDSLKRKRGSESGVSDRGSDDLRAEIKRLRQENEEKDSRLRQLEQAVMALQQSRR